MAEIVWTREALASIELIRAYVQQFNPSAAARLAARLIDVGDSLRDFPDRGRPVGGGRREMVTVRPYVLRYRFDGDTVFILGVRHMAQESNETS